ncbi:MAG: phosphatidylinositol kinase, partial [Actinomycetota bacterium]|nr:phosphatidylinositol kinase [Actinomycetota bacterium]
ADFKLRTVIWEFGGEPVPAELLTIAAQIADHVPLDVAALLADDEAEAVRERAEWVVKQGVFPVDSTGRRYPWPLV